MNWSHKFKDMSFGRRQILDLSLFSAIYQVCVVGQVNLDVSQISHL